MSKIQSCVLFWMDVHLWQVSKMQVLKNLHQWQTETKMFLEQAKVTNTILSLLHELYLPSPSSSSFRPYLQKEVKGGGKKTQNQEKLLWAQLHLFYSCLISPTR